MKLTAKVYHHHEDVYFSSPADEKDSVELEAVKGKYVITPFIFFIDDVTPEKIEIYYDGHPYILTPGNQVVLHMEIDGHEWSDGCVYDWTSYNLVITWDA